MKDRRKNCDNSQGIFLSHIEVEIKWTHFTDDIFKCIFFNEIFLFPIKISLKFVPRSLINNIPALVQIMAWRRPGDKPLSEPMMVNLSTHICVTRPQWVNVTLIKQVKEAYSNCKWLWHPAKSCLKETIPIQFFVFILCMHYINWARQYPGISTQTKDFPISYISFPHQIVSNTRKV